MLKRISVCLLFVKRRHFHRGRADGMRRSKLSRPSKRRVDPVRCVPKVKRNMTEEEKQARKDACAAIAAEKAPARGRACGDRPCHATRNAVSERRKDWCTSESVAAWHMHMNKTLTREPIEV